MGFHGRRTNSIAWLLSVSLILSGFLPSAGWAGSIFDDNWTPPRALEPDHEAAPAPLPQHPSPAPEVSPAPPPADLAAPTAAERRKIPAPSEQAKSRSLLKDAFAAQLADRSIAGRRKLVDVLMNEATKDAQNTSDQFVLFAGAIRSAQEAGDLQACFDAADQMASLYEVNALAVKTDAAMKMPAKNYKVNASDNSRAGLGLIDELIAAGDLADAQAISEILLRTSTGEAGLHNAVRKRAETVNSVREARTKIQADLEKLKSTPEDPAANGAVGSYYCFRLGRWDQGLAFLAHGADPAVKRLAIDELANPADADAVSALADAWWNVAAGQPEPCRPGILRHAGDLYSRVLDKLGGLKRAAAQKRVAQVRASENNGSVNLLAIIDLTKDAIAGDWRIEDGALVCAATSATRFEFPYVPPDEYDFRLTFQGLPFNDGVGQICSGRGRQFCWMVGAYNNTICGFESLNGTPTKGNRTAVAAKDWLKTGHRYVSTVKVRKDRVEAYLNGQLISTLKTNFSDLSLYPDYVLGHRDTLGALNFGNNIKIESAEVTEMTGTGHLAR